MLRFPMFGFSRRVEDAVARAMAILNTRQDYTARPVLDHSVMPIRKPPNKQ